MNVEQQRHAVRHVNFDRQIQRREGVTVPRMAEITVGIGAGLEQQPYSLHMVFADGAYERREANHARHIDTGASVEQQLHAVFMAAQSGRTKRTVVPPIVGVGGDALVKKLRNERSGAALARAKQRELGGRRRSAKTIERFKVVGGVGERAKVGEHESAAVARRKGLGELGVGELQQLAPKKRRVCRSEGSG